MTVEQLLSLADGMKKCEQPDEVRVRWIADVEGRVISEIHGLPADKAVLPTASEDTLTIPDSYGRVYLFYLLAMAALAEGDIATYSQLSRDFENALSMYARYYLRTR